MASRSLSVDQGISSFQRKLSVSEKVTFSHDEVSKTDAHLTSGIYTRTLPSLHFLRWRPIYHLLAPNAWMNDPCAPCFDPRSGLYHIYFQWNPRRNKSGNVSWGNMAWGHATSQDLTSWQVSAQPKLKPDKPYDREGVFTGCMQPIVLNGAQSTLRVVYTSVSKLPIHYTLPYDRGSETLSLAESKDGGRTWLKGLSNPILAGPPSDASVCGWRDPFIAPWPSIDRVLNKANGESSLYGTLSGGILDRTPTVFLYAVDKDNLGQWTYLSPLVDIGLNHCISRWSGDMGVNWEVANFMTLSDGEGESRDFILVGAEGCQSDLMHDSEEEPLRSTQVPRTARSQQWMSGSPSIQQGDSGPSLRMGYSFGGRYDHGCLYGVNSIYDVNVGRHIAWGWITEEDLPQDLVDRQNWSGLLSLPRELGLLTLHHVKSGLVSELKEITSLELTPEPNDLFTVRTLGMSPATATQKLREGSREVSVGATSLPQLNADNVAGMIWLDVRTARWELAAEMSLSETCKMIGLAIFHNQDGSSQTSITFSPPTETLTIDRSASTDADDRINTSAESAPHTLFNFQDASTSSSDPSPRQETLHLRAFFDESVLEVFANDRTVISTRVYPSQKRCYGIHFFSDDEDEDAMQEEEGNGTGGGAEEGKGLSRLVQARAWDGLRADIRIVD
ncbi:MAG: hypothetical protein Q9160_000925 [Pyrenula sp. 1 TL-2023]